MCEFSLPWFVLNLPPASHRLGWASGLRFGGGVLRLPRCNVTRSRLGGMDGDAGFVIHLLRPGIMTARSGTPLPCQSKTGSLGVTLAPWTAAQRCERDLTATCSKQRITLREAYALLAEDERTPEKLVEAAERVAEERKRMKRLEHEETTAMM